MKVFVPTISVSSPHCFYRGLRGAKHGSQMIYLGNSTSKTIATVFSLGVYSILQTLTVSTNPSKNPSLIVYKQAQAADGLDSDSDAPGTDDEMAQFDDGSDNDEELSDSVTVTRAINEYMRYDNLDFYTRDGLEACKETMDYSSEPLPTHDHQPPTVHYSRLSYKQLQRDLEVLEAQTTASLNPPRCQTPIEPNVYHHSIFPQCGTSVCIPYNHQS
jgi:hypothetical protein